MRHPFETWPSTGRRKALFVLIAAAALVGAALALLDGPLGETGDGTLAFEFAGTPERAAEIVATWDAAGVLEQAAFIAGLDFLYALLYAAAIAGACVAAAGVWRRLGRESMARIGIVAAWAASAAAVFDWLENLALTVVLLDAPASPWPQAAFAAAIPKFACIAAGLTFALSGLVVLVRRPSTADG